MLVNLQLLVTFKGCWVHTVQSIVRLLFQYGDGSDSVSNIRPANCPFSQSETELRRTQLIEVGSKELCSQLGARSLDTTHVWSQSTAPQPDGLGWESILRREETRVSGENRRSQVEIDWNSTHILQHTTPCRGGRGNCCPISTAQEIYPDGHPSRYQSCPRGLDFSEQNRCLPLVLAVHDVGFVQSRSGRLITNSVYTWVSEWHIAYRSPRKKPVSTLCGSTSLKKSFD